MNKLLKIDSIMFFVKDLKKSADFYGKTLGLKRAWTDKQHKMTGFLLAQSDSEIVIHNDKNMQKPEFSFLVDNVEKFCVEYKRKGFKAIKEPFEVRCGKFAVLADPDGNKISIIDLTKFGNKPRYD